MYKFICPVCARPLEDKGSSLRCEKGHNYDKSADGYVHLLPSVKMHSKLPGDNKLMVNARKSFLRKDYYKPFSNKINETAEKYLSAGKIAKPVILDAGCGEGYYTGRLNKHLTAKGMTPEMLGIDISKLAVKAAAKADKSVSYAVASLFSIPVATASCDCIVNIFAPIVPDEFRRVVKKGGCFITAGPSEDHLLELKQLIYDDILLNEQKQIEIDGFEQVSREKCSFEMNLETNDDVLNLFSMTPYCYKTPKEGVERLAKTQTLKVRAAFDIAVYKAV